MKVISLFSGAGGLDKGLILAGHQIIWANDVDKDAVETYRRNIGENIVHGDITTLDLNCIPDGDMVVGGFPCQGFSQANLKRSIDDGRNILYRYFCKVVELKKPKFFVAENVKGILSLGNGTVIQRIISDFEILGYTVNVKLVNMADYGVPQTRQRVIIVGQNQSVTPINFHFPKQTNSQNGVDLPKWISIKAAIEHFPDPDLPNDVLNHIYSVYKVTYRNFTGHRRTDSEKPSPTILARGNGKGGVCAIPHYNGLRRLTVRESASIQTFPEDYFFCGAMGSCYRQVGNAVPVRFAKLLGEEFKRLELQIKK